MNVKLVQITPNVEQQMVYIARVSNPKNQNNPSYAGLIRYCIEHQHWSVFEHGHMTLEIETSLAIATQILRHRSATFQQFSARYSDISELGFEPIQLRKQAEKNRQSSAEILEYGISSQLQDNIQAHLAWSRRLYLELLDAGVAKECARFVLPQCTTTRLYMTNNIRGWIHYIQQRTKEDVQLEHRQVALEAQRIFVEELPIISEALGWKGDRDAT